MIASRLERLPSELTKGDCFVVWKEESRTDGKKPTKVPYVIARPSTRASVRDPTTWGTFAEALACVSDGLATGIGRVLSGDLTVIDIDSCVDRETGKISPKARALVEALGS